MIRSTSLTAILVPRRNLFRYQANRHQLVINSRKEKRTNIYRFISLVIGAGSLNKKTAFCPKLKACYTFSNYRVYQVYVPPPLNSNGVARPENVFATCQKKYIDHHFY